MFKKKTDQPFKYPGIRMATDGNSAVIMCERESSDAAGAYPITPSTQMGEYWAEEAASGHLNISERPLIFLEPESEHAAAALTAGMAMTGLRATNFSSAQGVAFMHESLYAAAGKRLPYVLNMGCRAITKASLNVHCGHDDFHCVDDTGFLQVFARDAQGAADLNLIGRKIAELALTPAVVAQDGFLTTHLIEPLQVPERELIAEFLGRPDDMIECPTPAQKMIYGATRRRVPAIWDVDNPLLSGSVQNQDAYMQTVAAQRPYFYDHIPALTDQVMEEYHQLTGRRYHRVGRYRAEDADYLVIGMGSMIVQAEAVADHLAKTRKIRVGVLDITMFRPFPGDLLGQLLKGKRGVAVLERTDQPLASDLPLMREVRATVSKCIENGQADSATVMDALPGAQADFLPWPNYAVYQKIKDAPPLYSGAYGLGSRDLQPEALIAAVENMLPDGKRRKFFYLGIDFVREAINPKQEIHIQRLLDAYPKIGDLALHGTENPNLMPEKSITARIHSIGGWGAITTGKNLVMTLYELLGFEIKANPKYGSEKKGQPTTFYFSAAPEPIRVNSEYHFVDVVMSPDPNVFAHSDPLHGLKKGGVFIIQSSLDDDAFWASLPQKAQAFIIDNDVRVFHVDGLKIARDEASDPELQLRMQGNAFQGAFFAASPVITLAAMDRQTLFAAIEAQLQAKFGVKGERVVEDNLRVVRRGFDEVREITHKPLGESRPQQTVRQAAIPIMLKQFPPGEGKLANIHRFWERTGSLYAMGTGSDNLADPFQALSLIPAATGVFRDMSLIRAEVPAWVPENCTACGDCYTICPDSAIPGLVNTVGEVFESAIQRIEGSGTSTTHLRRETRKVERRLRELANGTGEYTRVRTLLDQAILETLAANELEGDARASLEAEFGLLTQALGSFEFAFTTPYWTQREKKQPGSGGLFSLTINPYTCKGCMECVAVCADDALQPVKETSEDLTRLRENWEFWLKLPSTSHAFSRIDNLNDKAGALETLLLDKRNYGSMVCGDGSCFGCGEKTVVHLFTSVVSALMQPRVRALVEKLDGLSARMEQHIRLRLAAGVDLNNSEALERALTQEGDLTLAGLSTHLDAGNHHSVLDPEWLRWATRLLHRLKDLRWRYVEGPNGRGRSDMGVINSTGCTSVWGSTYPYNPYPFPWTSHLFQDSPSMAMGIFEGHMTKMAEDFRAVREAELEVEGRYDPIEHDDFFRRFNWHQFSEEEWRLCPPVVALGGDGAMYDIGFQNLSRAMASGLPVKVLVVDTQAYSNTGGQACTSGFMAQVADMAPYGTVVKGKTEIRKEAGLLGIAHRTSYVLQGAISHTTHLLEGFIDGLNARRPALFNLYAVCPVEHGVGDSAADRQSRLAVESRAYPLLKYNPEAGDTFGDCLSLEGNPAIDQDWSTYTLHYTDADGNPASMELPLTFADFAATEGRFRKHFRQAPPETWNDDMVPCHEFLDLDEDEREDRFPYIWAVDGRNRLTRLLCSRELTQSTEERRQFWRQIRGMAGALGRAEIDALLNQAKAEMAQQLSSKLLALAAGGDLSPLTAAIPSGGRDTAVAAASPSASAASAGYESVWIETPECTACDECIDINPNIFAYNDRRQAIVRDPRGGSFRDIVKAAEKCTAGCIHPGTPFDPAEKDLDKLIKRAEKFQWPSMSA